MTHSLTTAPSTRRASRRITLVLIGSAAALAACAPSVQPSYQRDHYLTLEDCAADWGRPEACEAASGSATATTSGTTGSGGGYYFRGPIYSTGYRNDAQTAWRTMANEGARADGRPVASLAPSDRSVARSGPASRPVASSGSTARGGFGGSSRSFSAGG